MSITDWNSTPLINLSWNCQEGLTTQELVDLQKKLMSMHTKLRHPVESLKKLLGKQSYTWVGEFRFWVWEFKNWRVFASNKQGVSFEYREGISKKAALEAWNDFLTRIGVA